MSHSLLFKNGNFFVKVTTIHPFCASLFTFLDISNNNSLEKQVLLQKIKEASVKSIFKKFPQLNSIYGNIILLGLTSEIDLLLELLDKESVSFLSFKFFFTFKFTIFI